MITWASQIKAGNGKPYPTPLSKAQAIEKTPDGYEVEIRDLRYAVSGEMRHEAVAVIHTDANGKVTQDELRWERDLRRR